MKTKTILSIILILAIAPSLCTAIKGKSDKNTGVLLKKNLKELNSRYRKFINMVEYISTDEELKIFKKLPTVRDREVFIKFFWKHRDPVPSTPENEYKLEIEKRFAHVNSFFSRGTPLPGWKTARGKIYMVLGKPATIENFDNEQGLYPARVWSYYGDKELGLPTYFNIVFFKRRGTGDWILYNQTTDGPSALLITGDTISLKDYRTLYNDVKKLAPTLASPSVTMVPSDMPYNYRPSPLNNMIMSNVYKSPSKKLNVSYANHFMDYKGYVNVESSVDFIGNSGCVAVLKHDGFDNSFIHFSIKPKKLAVDFLQPKNKYYYNFKVIASIMQKERVLYQYTKNYEQYIDAANMDIIKAGGVVIHDAFPVIPGRFKVKLFIHNKVSDEFSYYEKSVNVPTSTAKPYLASPVAAYGKQVESDDFFSAYKINSERLSVDPDKSFAIDSAPYFLVGVYNVDRETWANGKVEWVLSGQKESSAFLKKGSILLKEKKFSGNMNFILPTPEKVLKTNYYDFIIRLVDHSGAVTDTKRTSFSVSPFKEVSRPTENFNRIQAT
ncbi:MAG: GWxTD domain-containing protein, partial [bacterium]|nr:GWxTD domain-containing protein [bacterium]